MSLKLAAFGSVPSRTLVVVLHDDRLYVSVIIKVHSVNAHNTMMRRFAGDRSSVVANVPLVGTGNAYYRMMTSTGRNRFLRR